MPDRDTSGFTPLPDEIVQAAETRRRNTRANRRLLNLLSVLFLIAAVVLCGVYIVIWNDPYSALNPLPPNTPFPLMISETPQASPTPAIPTRAVLPTSDSTTAPIEAVTEEPGSPTGVVITITDTPNVTMTFTPIPASALGIVLGTPDSNTGGGESGGTAGSGMPFILQGDRAFYLTNPDGRGGCAWSSITGTVIDSTGAAVTGYGVHITGEGIDQIVATGSEPSAGLGGFELQLGSEAADGSYSLQLIDPRGMPVSDTFTVRTRADCQYNIAAVHFVQSGQ